MRRPGSHFSNLRIRSGIFYFLCLLAVLNAGRRMLPDLLRRDLPLMEVDSLSQAILDSLARAAGDRKSPVGYPRDPNYLKDFEGYRLGLSPASLDSLYAYRLQGGRIRSLAELGQVTGLAETALVRLRPLLRFPASGPPVRKAAIRVLNAATAAELREIRGIGPVLSARIVRFRQALGGFRDVTQLYDVYGLDPEVADRAMRSFAISRPVPGRLLAVNSATAAELAALPYINRQMADTLVALRKHSGLLKSLDELASLWGLPQNKVERIALYLTLETE